MAENVIDLPQTQRSACLKVLTNQEKQKERSWYQTVLNSLDFLFRALNLEKNITKTCLHEVILLPLLVEIILPIQSSINAFSSWSVTNTGNLVTIDPPAFWIAILLVIVDGKNLSGFTLDGTSLFNNPIEISGYNKNVDGKSILFVIVRVITVLSLVTKRTVLLGDNG